MAKISKKTKSPRGAGPRRIQHERPVARVAEVMTREVVTLAQTESFDRAVTLMANSDFQHCVIVDQAGKVAGVISDRDILRAVARATDWQSKSVANVMTREPVTVRAETALSEAVRKMISRGIHCLPVTDDGGRVEGILTSTDLLNAYQKVLQPASKRPKRE
ncbi:MAG TPA: CBS domain-containing protein [Candidatus Eisenbacteria bacterium]|nr:CBS domain-containing protein [Candidatus Eisenbacteria bacterium]